MATSVTANLIRNSFACLDLVWLAIIVSHCRDYKFCRAVDAHEVFYSRPATGKPQKFY